MKLKIGKSLGFFFWSVLLCSQGALAVPRLTVTLDREQIGEDESVLLKFSVEADRSGSMGEPKFQAPDFEEVNQYSDSFMRSTWENGQMSTVTTESITKVLRPLKTGQLTIRQPSVVFEGELLRGQDLSVNVVPSGAGSPPPQRYGSGTGGGGLRGAQKQTGRGILLRAEVDKTRLYKGEQVIVSYYLYKRTAVENINITKFPELKGFLREEIEMPVVQGRLNWERVVMDGVPYNRALLIRYAAYPVESGRLRVDSMEMKYNYFTNRGAFLDEEDDPFSQFFQRLLPQSGQTRNDPLTIEAMPLPSEQKPASFSGGVGDFSIDWAVDKTQVKANEAVTVTVKIEGKGNVGALGEPKTNWPKDVELYDSKVNSKTGRGGVGTKVFEFLLIPRSPGPLVLDGVELSYFDPASKKYQVKKTESLTLQVLPGDERNERGEKEKAKSSIKGSKEGSAAEKPEGLGSSDSQSRVLKSVGLGLATLLAFVGLVAAILSLRRRNSDQEGERQAVLKRSTPKIGDWSKVQGDSRGGQATLESGDLLKAYDRLCDRIFEELDSRFEGLASRSRSRDELKRILLEERKSELSMADQEWLAQSWNSIAQILEKAEMARFSGSSIISQERARDELPSLVEEARRIFKG